VPDPPPHTDPSSLEALFARIALRAAASFLHIKHLVRIPPTSVREVDPVASDLPVPFGSRIAWLAVDTTETEAVATALGLRGVREATWAEGIEAAHCSAVFVTPPVADWTLAVGTALFPPDKAEAFIKPLLERLSRQFDDVQYFGTHRDVELHLWARARKGKLVRGYGWLGQKALTLWNEGAPTPDERDLGFRFHDRPAAATEQAFCTKETRHLDLRSPDAPSPEAEQAYGLDLPRPNESCVLRLACLWSIDPTTLSEEFKEPVLGLLGSLARAKHHGSP
jgi:hypothetical protein